MRGKLSAVNGPAYGKVDGCSVEYYYQDNDENGDMVGFGWRELHCRGWLMIHWLSSSNR